MLRMHRRHILKKTANDGSGTASNMLVTQKKQYALRAIFELAKQQGEEPLKHLTNR
jgi:hypothetical protein